MDITQTVYNHFHFFLDEQQIGWLTIDVADTSTNVLSQEVISELQRVLKEIRTVELQALIILSAKNNGFIAGADINAFTELGTGQEALELIQQGQGVFTELEDLPFPTIAIIHGFCLGGGLELALACTYRIAADEPETKIGLPEVKLGIHPGFGGTVRLIRQIGGPAALPLILSGKILTAAQGARIGILTYAVPRRNLKNAAIQIALSPPAPKKDTLGNKLVASSLGRSLVARIAKRKLQKRVREIHYPAPYAVLDLYKKFGGSFTTMMEQEAHSVARLIRGETAQNLIRCYFLQQQLKSQPGASAFYPQNIHIVGAGVMGGDIAAWCALKGYKVSIQDNSHEILARVVQRASRLFQKKLKRRHLISAAMDRFIPDLNGVHVAKADVVIEAIFEDVTAKKNVFSIIEPQLKPEALFATNTSSIPLETLAQNLQYPDRLVGLHFFNPVPKMQLVEVVGTEYSSQDSLQKAVQFTKSIGKLPLPVRSAPGFLINRILMPYLHEAAILENDGVPPEAIDQVAEEFGMPVGPIELMDMVGLDICQSVVAFMGKNENDLMPKSFQSLLNQGRVGKKSGAGYYIYKGNKPQKKRPQKHFVLPGDIIDRMILRMVNESISCLREKVVSDSDLLDAGMIFGTGFAPFRGGVIQHMHRQTAAKLYDRLLELERSYGERFKPDAGWQNYL
ncbi:3-hydroxyacyl-CoA dehydrogenase NAD-binding domain-containing protein [Desulfogranum japonicum]|uniref:3-hydroxyacyl-CoA dehydrogenase NAD-binding domain-containing protein n=1 Tax=Desulfogranum japonicum TaxID=231447 RepID=UPI00041B6E47|nr:3-hydroxyacyl-CoA dehydrogenase NAD-binding domain-containing protein [Desulfogranum japonicum]